MTAHNDTHCFMPATEASDVAGGEQSPQPEGSTHEEAPSSNTTNAATVPGPAADGTAVTSGGQEASMMPAGEGCELLHQPIMLMHDIKP